MQWDFIWVQANGSPRSPGNDLCGLNDDPCEHHRETKGIQQHRVSSEMKCLHCFTSGLVKVSEARIRLNALDLSLIQTSQVNSSTENLKIINM